MSLRRLALIALLCAAPTARADVAVFDNGAPFISDSPYSRDISLFRSADDFTVGAVELTAIRFWINATDPVATDPQTSFSGSITYAIYADAAGDIGSLIASDTANGLVSTYTGLTFGFGENANVLDVPLQTPVALGAGTYWLEVHEGPTLATTDDTHIGWVVTDNATGNAKQGLATNGLPTGGVNNELAFQLLPEPASPALGASALLGLALAARRSRRSQPSSRDRAA